MLENVWLIPVSKHPVHPSRPAALTLGRSSYANFPGLGMTIRRVSLRAHQPGRDYSSLASTPRPRAQPRSSHLLPPAHTLDGSAARISMQDFLMILEKKKKKKHNRQIILTTY